MKVEMQVVQQTKNTTVGGTKCSVVFVPWSSPAAGSLTLQITEEQAEVFTPGKIFDVFIQTKEEGEDS